MGRLLEEMRRLIADFVAGTYAGRVARLARIKSNIESFLQAAERFDTEVLKRYDAAVVNQSTVAAYTPQNLTVFIKRVPSELLTVAVNPPYHPLVEMIAAYIYKSGRTPFLLLRTAPVVENIVVAADYAGDAATYAMIYAAYLVGVAERVVDGTMTPLPWNPEILAAGDAGGKLYLCHDGLHPRRTYPECRQLGFSFERTWSPSTNLYEALSRILRD